MVIRHERFSYPFGAKAIENGSSVNAVHHKRALDRLEQMAEQNAVKKKDEAILKKDWKEDVQLRAKFKLHGPAFLEIVGEFENVWDGQLERINVEKHRMNFFNDYVRPFHSAIYQAGPPARKFAAEKID